MQFNMRAQRIDRNNRGYWKKYSGFPQPATHTNITRFWDVTTCSLKKCYSKEIDACITELYNTNMTKSNTYMFVPSKITHIWKDGLGNQNDSTKTLFFVDHINRKVYVSIHICVLDCVLHNSLLVLFCIIVYIVYVLYASV
jgi:hypothetical protein